MSFVTRFAPSPTGYLHRGHAFSAWTAHDAARAAGGRFLLRIEDIDAGRRRPEFDAAIEEDLAWLGLTWDGPVRRQSAHMADYAAVLDQLIARGLVYRCFKTRKELMAGIENAPHGRGDVVRSAPLPAAEERTLMEDGRPYAWRLSLDACRAALGPAWTDLDFQADGARVRAEPERLGDVVVARKEFPTSYHLASVHDDALQGVTHVIRGEDLREAAHLHVLLQALFGWPTPAYRHHPLILDAEGRRLAKRDAAETLRALRATGRTPADIRASLRLPVL
ncbi:MAG: tRNA glutamyl-Q(34) synthetase GluQRS [Alphaproteobacteria bacterium]|nr:tRNA glutamyl-Q(34) synthetase GluQRS [Alphaproteobacteria bacterium]